MGCCYGCSNLLRFASVERLTQTQLAASVQGAWGRTGFATNSHDIFNVVRGRLPLHTVVARVMWSLCCCGLRWLGVRCATSRLSVRCMPCRQLAPCVLRVLAPSCGPSWLRVYCATLCCVLRTRFMPTPAALACFCLLDPRVACCTRACLLRLCEASSPCRAHLTCKMGRSTATAPATPGKMTLTSRRTIMSGCGPLRLLWIRPKCYQQAS